MADSTFALFIHLRRQYEIMLSMVGVFLFTLGLLSGGESFSLGVSTSSRHIKSPNN